MDRRSFLLTALLPVVAAKQGLLGLHHPPLFVPWWSDRKFSILTLKARSIGMSTLVHNRMVAAQTAIQVVVFVIVVWMVYKVLEYLFYSFFALTKMM